MDAMKDVKAVMHEQDGGVYAGMAMLVKHFETMHEEIMTLRKEVAEIKTPDQVQYRTGAARLREAVELMDSRDCIRVLIIFIRNGAKRFVQIERGCEEKPIAYWSLPDGESIPFALIGDTLSESQYHEKGFPAAATWSTLEDFSERCLGLLQSGKNGWVMSGVGIRDKNGILTLTWQLRDDQ